MGAVVEECAALCSVKVRRTQTPSSSNTSAADAGPELDVTATSVVRVCALQSLSRATTNLQSRRPCIWVDRVQLNPSLSIFMSYALPWWLRRCLALFGHVRQCTEAGVRPGTGGLHAAARARGQHGAPGDGAGQRLPLPGAFHF